MTNTDSRQRATEVADSWWQARQQAETVVVDTALDSAAERLSNGEAGLDDLAAAFVDGLEPGKRIEVLLLLTEDAIGGLIAGHCLLDECDNASYAIQQEMGYTLAHAIALQYRTDHALRELAADQIALRAEVRCRPECQPECHHAPEPVSAPASAPSEG